MWTEQRKIGAPERPAELTYALDEIPPWPHLLGLGFQARCRHLPLSGHGGPCHGSRETPAPSGGERHQPRHDGDRVHDGVLGPAMRTHQTSRRNIAASNSPTFEFISRGLATRLSTVRSLP